MLAAGAAAVARRQPQAVVARPLRQLAQRRYASAEHHHHAEPVNEGFGRSFYLVLALFPASYILYTVSRPRGANQPHPWTKALESYSDWKAEWTRRNANHTKLVEQAGRDRNLFLNTPMPNHIELGMPELIGVSSPINVPAGHQPDLQQVIAHYRQRQFKEEAEKLEKQRQGKLGEAPPSQQ